MLQIHNLSVTFDQLKVISDLSLEVKAGEILAVAGSSGSGKSLMAHAVLGILPKNAKVEGEIWYNGVLLEEEVQKNLRGKEIALIPQSVTYLDPLMKIGKQVRGIKSKKTHTAKQKDMFQRMGLPEETETMYPFQLSGGMARRVLFSTAAIGDESLIIADEPTPGMHKEQAIEALSILREMADQGRSVILITHDIDLAVDFADKVAVFYAGTIVEVALAADFSRETFALRHPYSRALWEALPQNGFKPLSGFQPYADDLPEGCLFAERCPHKQGICEQTKPSMRNINGGMVKCRMEFS